MKRECAHLSEVDEIEGALDCLLLAVTENRAPGRPLPLVSVAESIREMFRPATRAERRAAELFRDPVGRALRHGVRTLGERLHEIGGLELMSTMLDQVAERDPMETGRRAAVMDHAWDGIGRANGSPGCCA